MITAVTFSAMMPMSATAAAFPVMLVIAAMAAFSVVLMAVMAAKGVRVIIEVSGKKCFHCGVCISTHARIQFDACFGKSCSCAASDPAADQHIHFQTGKKSCQRAVAVSGSIHHFLMHYFIIFHIVQLHLAGVTKMLIYISIFISYCDSHSMRSFLSLRCFRLSIRELWLHPPAAPSAAPLSGRPAPKPKRSTRCCKS